MENFEIGELYQAGKTFYPTGEKFLVRNGDCELLLFINKPSEFEVDAILNGTGEFGLVIIDEIVIFLYRFGSEISWNNCSFTAHQIPEEERLNFEIDRAHDKRLILNVRLIDASNGKIRTLRSLSLTNEFAAELLKNMRLQLESSFDEQAYYAKINAIHNRYRSVYELVQKCNVFSKRAA